jgi:hypothetical protein
MGQCGRRRRNGGHDSTKPCPPSILNGVRPNQERRRFPHLQTMTTPQHHDHHDQDSPVGEAMAWASRIIAIGIAMFLPAVVGNWLDSRLGTGFLGMAGLVLGFVLGLTWLVQLSRRRKP